MTTTQELPIEDGIVTTMPGTFAQAVDVARRDNLRGVTIREDWRDLEPDAPACDLSALASVPHLEHFAVAPINGSRLLHVDGLYALTNLRSFSIHEYRTIDLSHFRQLEVLHVRDRPGLKGLGALENLRRLQVWGLRQGDFTKVSLPRLEFLRVIQAARTVTSTLGFDKLGALRELDLSHCRSLAALGALPPNLATLRVEACPGLVDFRFLGGNPSIDFLFATTMESLSFVPSMTALTRLGFANVTDGDLSPALRRRTLRGIFFSDRKHYSHVREDLQGALDARSQAQPFVGAPPSHGAGRRARPSSRTGRMSSGRATFLDRWRRSMAEGDGQLTAPGIEAVTQALEKFEGDARKAAGDTVGLREILRQTVLELDRLGGENGMHGCFLETDEREELVPYLLEVVSACGLDVGDDDPTEPYRPW